MNPESILGKKSFKPQESWKDAAENIKSIHDVYTLDSQDEIHMEQAKELIVKTSFFLPKEILSSDDVKVSQLVIMSEKDFFNFWHATTMKPSYVHSFYHDVALLLILRAKNVGMSARWYKNKLYLVCKVWYGGNVNTDSSKDANAAHRLRKLREFCKL